MVIETLVDDIQSLLSEGVEITDKQAEEFAQSLISTLKEKLHPDGRKRKATLRMSNIGKPARQLWYEINMPEKAEKLHPNAYMKFLMGDIIEEVLIFLTKLSGHSITGSQDQLEIEGIKGHRDGIIDGLTIDFKSASPYSFKKFQNGLKAEEDSFGYLQQIQNYLHAGQSDDLVIDKDRGAFVVLNKVTGDLVIDIHDKTVVPVDEIIKHKIEMVQQEEPPERCFEDEPQFKPKEGQKSNGNRKLGVVCSYCPFKKECWPELRTFLYSYGPMFLTHVEKEPRVPEVKEDEE